MRRISEPAILSNGINARASKGSILVQGGGSGHGDTAGTSPDAGNTSSRLSVPNGQPAKQKRVSFSDTVTSFELPGNKPEKNSKKPFWKRSTSLPQTIEPVNIV